MRHADDQPMMPVVLRKSKLQLAHNCRTQHKKCCGILKQLLKSYNSRGRYKSRIRQL